MLNITTSRQEILDNSLNVENGGVDNPAYENEEKRTEVAEEDVWALPELQVDFTPWSQLTIREKIVRVLWHYIGKIVLLLGFLYLFICSLSFLGDAFNLLGGKTAGKAFSENKILANPVAGLMIGVLATVLLQSSSTTTSIVVSMVGGGELLTVPLAIPIIMGANIGTSITNTIVSLGQIANKNDFRRAFAGATVHDVFNWLTVLVLLPLEVVTGYLEKVTNVIVDSMDLQTNMGGKRDFLNVVTKPFTSLIIQIEKDVIKNIATGKISADKTMSIIKHVCCDKVKNATTVLVNGTLVKQVKEVKVNCGYCTFMFEYVSRDGGWSDAAVGGVLLLVSLVILCSCLIGIVKCLHSLLRGQMAHVIRKFINADFPGHCGYFTGYLAILVGAGMTMLVQSSSVFTSSLTPLVGIGVLSVERMYPLTLGSNIGTTATSILAAFAQDPKKIRNSLQIALCHLFFNISGTIIFYPLPFFRPAIGVAKFLGNQTAKYRWFAVAYLICAFFLFPAALFGLSVVSWIALAAVLIPIALLILTIGAIKIVQHRCPTSLPPKLRTWMWLPVYCRSLEPYDRGLFRLTGNCYFCRKVGCCKAFADQPAEETARLEVELDLSTSADTTVKQSDNGMSSRL